MAVCVLNSWIRGRKISRSCCFTFVRVFVAARFVVGDVSQQVHQVSEIRIKVRQRILREKKTAAVHVLTEWFSSRSCDGMVWHWLLPLLLSVQMCFVTAWTASWNFLYIYWLVNNWVVSHFFDDFRLPFLRAVKISVGSFYQGWPFAWFCLPS